MHCCSAAALLGEPLVSRAEASATNDPHHAQALDSSARFVSNHSMAAAMRQDRTCWVRINGAFCTRDGSSTIHYQTKLNVEFRQRCSTRLNQGRLYITPEHLSIQAGQYPVRPSARVVDNEVDEHFCLRRSLPPARCSFSDSRCLARKKTGKSSSRTSRS